MGKGRMIIAHQLRESQVPGLTKIVGAVSKPGNFISMRQSRRGKTTVFGACQQGLAGNHQLVEVRYG